MDFYSFCNWFWFYAAIHGDSNQMVNCTKSHIEHWQTPSQAAATAATMMPSPFPWPLPFTTSVLVEDELRRARERERKSRSERDAQMIREWLKKRNVLEVASCGWDTETQYQHQFQLPHMRYTHTHTYSCVWCTGKAEEEAAAAQGNGYADDEQKLKPINHFDLFCSFFRLKLILMPSVAWQRGCPGAAQESVRKRERERERECDAVVVFVVRIIRAAHKKYESQKDADAQKATGFEFVTKIFDSFPRTLHPPTLLCSPLFLARRASGLASSSSSSSFLPLFGQRKFPKII